MIPSSMAIPSQIGMVPGQPGMVPAQIGMVPAQPGMVPAQIGMVPGQASYLSQGCNPCRISCQCGSCRRKQKHRKCDSDDEKSNGSRCKPPCKRCLRDDCICEKKRNRKQCNKCYRFDCDCIEFFPCLQTKCGLVSATLTKTATPTFFTAAGQIITYSYTLTNTGTVPICGQIQICDNRLGVQIIPCVFIPPCSSQTFTRTYTTVPTDLTTPSITNTATACFQVTRRKAVCTPPASATITFGVADVFGSIVQTLTPGTGGTGGTGTVNVFISNMAPPNSQTAAFGIQLILPFPAGITFGQISGLTGFAPASTPTVNATGVVINEATIPVASTYHYQFTYGPLTAGSYTWSGTITTQSFDPNLTNNTLVSNAIVVS
jgi:uncharacterized repeat protein (TIGR01451 family)